VGLAAAASAATINPSVVAQTATVTIGRTQTAAVMNLDVQLGGVNGDGATATLTIFPPVHTRSEVDLIVNGAGTNNAALATSGSFPLDCRSHGVAHLRVTLSKGPLNARGCGDANLDLALRCAQSCDGVYPLLISVSGDQDTVQIWTLETVVSPNPVRPLNVLVIDALDATSPPRRVLDALNQATASPVPLTLLPSNDLLVSALTSPNLQEGFIRYVANGSHHIAADVSSNLDLGALTESGLGHDTVRALQLSQDLLHVIAPGSRVESTVVLNGTTSRGTLNVLRALGTKAVILNERALTSAPSVTLHWGSPFYVTGVGKPLVAQATDTGLHQLLDRNDIEPARLAALAIGELGLLYYEAPNSAATRSVTIVANPLQGTINTLSFFLGDLRTDRVARAVSASDVVRATDIGANHAPTMRTIVTHPSSRWHPLEIRAATDLWIQSTSLSQALSNPGATLVFDVDRLTAEAVATHRLNALNAVNRKVVAFTQNFRIANDSITISDSGTPIPLTVTSHVPYLVTGVLHLHSTTLRFPDGNAIPLSLSNATAITRIRVSIPAGGSGIIDARLTTPDGKVTLALASIQIHSAATSVVGYVLTAGSLLIIGWWWLRTYRRKRRM
jgi:hypothetical protein